MNRLSKLLLTLSAALSLTVPVFAEGQALGANFGGLDTLIMATVLLVFGFIMQRFLK